MRPCDAVAVPDGGTLFRPGPSQMPRMHVQPLRPVAPRCSAKAELARPQAGCLSGIPIIAPTIRATHTDGRNRVLALYVTSPSAASTRERDVCPNRDQPPRESTG